jgi:aminopeptidase YwaD
MMLNRLMGRIHSISIRVRQLLAILLLAVTTGCAAPVGDLATPTVAIAGTSSATAVALTTVVPSTLPSRPTVAAAPLAAASTASATAVTSAQPSPVAPTALPAPTPSNSASVVEPFSGQRALNDVEWLAETVGSRPAGSDSERQAAEGLAERLRRLGYDVGLQPFPVRRFEDRGSVLRLAEQPDTRLEVHALLNSLAGTVSGRLVDVGLGRNEDLEGRDLRGAIALIKRGELTFAEKARNASAAGAVGALIYNQESGSFRGMLAEAASIPVVALSDVDGQRLERLLAGGQIKAELTVDAQMIEATSNNVVARMPGATESTIVLGAHYDSVAEGPGANDNASGTATVLELARVLPAMDLPFTLQIVLFGAEEIGLVGSRHYVGALGPQERERIAAMLNFDMVGVGDQQMVGGSAELVDLAVASAEENGTRLGQLSGGALDRSDQASFLDANIPAIFLHRSDDPNYHTAEDRAEYVDADRLAAAGQLALALLDRIATAIPAAAR